MDYKGEQRKVIINDRVFDAFFVENHSKVEAVVDKIRDCSKDDFFDFREIIYVKWKGEERWEKYYEGKLRQGYEGLFPLLESLEDRNHNKL